MNPAYDSYNYSYVGPYREDSQQRHFSDEDEPKWYFIWDNIQFGPYVSQREAWENFESLKDCGEAQSCSAEYRDEC